MRLGAGLGSGEEGVGRVDAVGGHEGHEIRRGAGVLVAVLDVEDLEGDALAEAVAQARTGAREREIACEAADLALEEQILPVVVRVGPEAARHRDVVAVEPLAVAEDRLHVEGAARVPVRRHGPQRRRGRQHTRAARRASASASVVAARVRDEEAREEGGEVVRVARRVARAVAGARLGPRVVVAAVADLAGWPCFLAHEAPVLEQVDDGLGVRPEVRGLLAVEVVDRGELAHAQGKARKAEAALEPLLDERVVAHERCGVLEAEYGSGVGPVRVLHDGDALLKLAVRAARGVREALNALACAVEPAGKIAPRPTLGREEDDVVVGAVGVGEVEDVGSVVGFAHGVRVARPGANAAAAQLPREDAGAREDLRSGELPRRRRQRRRGSAPRGPRDEAVRALALLHRPVLVVRVGAVHGALPSLHCVHRRRRLPQGHAVGDLERRLLAEAHVMA